MSDDQCTELADFIFDHFREASGFPYVEKNSKREREKQRLRHKRKSLTLQKTLKASLKVD